MEFTFSKFQFLTKLWVVYIMRSILQMKELRVWEVKQLIQQGQTAEHWAMMRLGLGFKVNEQKSPTESSGEKE